MLSLPFVMVAAAFSTPAPSIPGGVLDEAAPVHLAITLRSPNPDDLDRFLAELQDPGSPRYHAWVTPAEFGERFGLPLDRYERVASWLSHEGFTLTRYPNRLFFEAVGTSAATRHLLGVQLRHGSRGGREFHTFDGALTFPKELAGDVLHVGGLDTRTHLHHHLNVNYGGQNYQALGPDDFRVQYNMASLASSGHAASGLSLAVLGTQEGTASGNNVVAPWIPPTTLAIQAYFTLAGATATYNPIELPNSGGDFDYPGSNEEYQLDVEMQSVAAPNAASINLVLSPASEVFETGAQYIVNTLSTAVTVSTSLGLCESEEQMYNGGGPGTAGSEPVVMQQAIKQGLAEGQTWFAAAGDTGADDCNDSNSGMANGFGGSNATVDFPGTMPEFVDMGGTQFNGAGSWSGSGALLAAVPEVVWNEGQQDGAGGGGQSLFYAKPTWQDGIGAESGDHARDVPDISLAAATSTPGVAVYECGAGQDSSDCQGENTGTGDADIVGGTSVAAPLAAGIFALLSSEVGCRLGDIHPALYQLGAAQKAGGPAVFDDVVSGNNSFKDPSNVEIDGFPAAAGYDLASGWGSLEVATLIANWPACTPTTTTSSSASSGSSGSVGVTTSASSSSSSGSTRSSSTTTAAGSSGGSSSTSGPSVTATASSTGTSSGATGTTGGGNTTGSLSGLASSTGGSSSAATPAGCGCGSMPREAAGFWLSLSVFGIALRPRRTRFTASVRTRS